MGIKVILREDRDGKTHGELIPGDTFEYQNILGVFFEVVDATVLQNYDENPDPDDDEEIVIMRIDTGQLTYIDRDVPIKIVNLIITEE